MCFYFFAFAVAISSLKMFLCRFLRFGLISSSLLSSFSDSVVGGFLLWLSVGVNQRCLRRHYLRRLFSIF
ncbi:hypothetical protein Hdeb2414_s0402g00886711 [Helianthus debilis subsp. tardiflorus]